RLHNGTDKVPANVIIERGGVEYGRDRSEHSVKRIVGLRRRAFRRRIRVGVARCYVDDLAHRQLQGRKRVVSAFNSPDTLRVANRARCDIAATARAACWRDWRPVAIGFSPRLRRAMLFALSGLA